MRFLPDTHLLIWTSQNSQRLSAAARNHIGDPANEIFFSAISIWEVAIKQSLQRATFTVDAHTLRRGLLARGFRELSLTSDHAVQVAMLPKIHQDPFDRILIAQAISEDITLLTVDADIAKYPGPIRKV